MKNRLENGAGNIAVLDVPEAPAKATKKSKTSVTVGLKALDIKTFPLKLRSASPLVIHKFTEKSKKAIEEKQGAKANKPRATRDPQAECWAACYVMPGSPPAGKPGAVYGIPARMFKMSAVNATRYLDGLNKTYAHGAFFVVAEADGLVKMKCSKPRMLESAVKIGKFKETLDLRYRPIFDEWEVTLTIRYNASIISVDQIVNLFHYSGFHIGVGDQRRERGFDEGSYAVAE